MLVLQVMAALLLLLAFGLFFMPQIVAYGPQTIPGIVRHPQTRFVGGFLVTTLALLVTGPHFGAALISGGEHLTVFALDLAALSFGLI